MQSKFYITFLLNISISLFSQIKQDSIKLLQIEYEIRTFNNDRIIDYDKSFITEDRIFYENIGGRDIHFFNANNRITSTEKSVDYTKIKKTLQNYIEGSTNGKPQLLERVFYKDLQLYYVKNDSLKTWSGKDYILSTKEGKPTGEIGKILLVDYTNNTAVAKVEISHPKSKNLYIDYFMLLKLEGKWIIIHKMFTKKITNR